MAICPIENRVKLTYTEKVEVIIMDLYKEILIHVLLKQDIKIDFPNLNINIQEIFELTCYQALQKIKEIIHNDSLEDAECFTKIEEIICLYESIGSNGGNRHDFG